MPEAEPTGFRDQLAELATARKNAEADLRSGELLRRVMPLLIDLAAYSADGRVAFQIGPLDGPAVSGIIDTNNYTEE